MRVIEFRIVIPLSVEQYEIGMLYSVSETSKQETGGGEGVQILENYTYDTEGADGQYTYKIYHFFNKLPAWVRILAPASATRVHEEAWNTYPYCRTSVSNPEFMKDSFFIYIESLHVAGRTPLENALKADQETLAKREVVYIDMEEDEQFQASCANSSGGTIPADWKKNPDSPVMTVYKLVKIKFQWVGVQQRTEDMIFKNQKRALQMFHRKLLAWMDRWIDLNKDDIRRIEEETKEHLDRERTVGEIKGEMIQEED
ncbi:phosphatidylinositol transfer protein beta isoform isoform X2 [Eurytemora carolleeae]|uniref:phosphatidylinositol transfer protein beta isoform isoform X2 n=1 Tax=Eurytemora carolleeae TaxID=1294199 RepID=UPI000C76FD27|nr:phosphatidylinositol transfer protein beta isoform isoform X2 [Eurytemora carolleeae]|eukprot:XP_023333267.1 phosphatidylinositol transfer protein beta isoform-like isoform X2 [Eurytemora affinis]